MPTPTRILFVEDDLNLRELYQEILSVSGYQVETAVDGEDGLAKLQQGGYDLVLLDMMLPKLNGVDILKTLQTQPPLKPNGVIILMTNMSQDLVIEEAMSLGASSHVVKSEMTPKTLLAIIEEKVKSQAQTNKT